MRKGLISLLFICVVVLFLNAEDEPEKKLGTFWGVPWRTSINDVKGLLKNKDCKLIEEGTTKDGCYGLICDGTFAGSKAEIRFFFYKDRLFSGRIYYPYKEGEVLNTYMEVKRLLEKKYGNATYVEEAKLSVYNENSTSGELLIKSEGLKFAAKWEFTDENYIIINVTKDLGTLVTYTSNSLRNKALKEQEEVKLNDF
ncbi:MAG: hypothetical protein ACTTJ6_07250 [Treponema sp.]